MRKRYLIYIVTLILSAIILHTNLKYNFHGRRWWQTVHLFTLKGPVHLWQYLIGLVLYLPIFIRPVMGNGFRALRLVTVQESYSPITFLVSCLTWQVAGDTISERGKIAVVALIINLISEFFLFKECYNSKQSINGGNRVSSLGLIKILNPFSGQITNRFIKITFFVMIIFLLFLGLFHFGAI